MPPSMLETIPGWAATMVGLGAGDEDLPVGTPDVNVALNRRRLAEFLAEFSEDTDLQNLLQLDALAMVTGIQVSSTGLVEDFPGLAIRPFRLWEYVWLFKVLELSRRDLEVLDLGGPASHLVLMTARAGNRVVTIDINPEIVDAARHCVEDLQLRTLEPRIGDMRDLAEIPETSFDRIICCSVLEHLTTVDQGRAISEMARVLRPGGVIGLTFDYGPPAPGANIDLPPPHEPPQGPGELVRRYVRDGLCILGNRKLETPIPGGLFRHETVRYTVGSLFLGKPPLKNISPPRPVGGNIASVWSVPAKAFPHIVFQQTTSKRKTVESLASRLSKATEMTHHLSIENQGLRSENQGLRSENQGLRSENQGLRSGLLAATSSLGWRVHHWIRSVLGSG